MPRKAREAKQKVDVSLIETKSRRRRRRRRGEGKALPEAKRGGRPTNVTEAREMMAVNAKGYIESVMNPFEVQNMRMPSAAPFPSTVGTSHMRYLPGEATPAGTPRMTAIAFGVDLTAGGHWTSVCTDVNASGVDTKWATSVHPFNTSFSANFAYMRTISMGVRVENVGELLKRGGALYVSYYNGTMPDAVVTGITALLVNADETRIFDAASLDEDGLEAVWIPMSTDPIAQAPAISPTGSTYVNPAIGSSVLRDSSIVIWAVSTDGASSLDLVFEQVHNWEAIPYPQTEYLFERKTILGSPQGIAEAKVASKHAAVSTVSKPKPGSKGWGSFGAGLKSIAGGTFRQIASHALTTLGPMLAEMLMSPAEWKQHTIALACHMPELSPLNFRGDGKVKKTLADGEFFAILCECLKFASIKEASEEASKSGSAFPSWFKVPSPDRKDSKSRQ